MSLWYDLEVAARRKLDLPEHYQLCDVELLPHQPTPWVTAKVSIGVKLTGYGHESWVDIKRTTIRPDEIEEK